MKRVWDVVFTVRMRARTQQAAQARAERIAAAIEERVSVESVEVEVDAEEADDGRVA